jgi:hypothetical protein
VIVEAARIAGRIGPAVPERIRVSRSSDALTARIAASLALEGVTPPRGRSKRDAIVTAGSDGCISLAWGTRKRIDLSDIHTAAGALALIARSLPPTDLALGSPEHTPDSEVIDLIVRPPARMLSETTSKRLLAAYGIAAGPERLCSSPTEAARFWQEIGRPVVLKLVRPELEHKHAGGAVIKEVTGAAGVRRAYHALGSTADSLGPPKPLGVLVAEQLDGGARIWLRTTTHRRYGTLVVGGLGDSPTTQPSLAMTAPVSANAAYAALTRAGVDATHGSRLALVVSRFGTMVDDLGDRIDRAEIHPLVALDGHAQALALDALVEISG